MDQLVLLLPALPLLSALCTRLLSGVMDRGVVRIGVAGNLLTLALAASVMAETQRS
ncbi:MAG: hypothetical protein R3E89_08425 [Thiolinea sp.]